MRIGKYHISLRKPGSLIFPIIVLSFCIAYLIQSRKIFSELSMILVRITFFAILIFTFFVIREEIKITSEKKTGSQKLFVDKKSKRIWFFIIGMGAYIFLIDKIGFTFSTLFFTSAMMNILGVKDLKILIFLPICFLIVIYLTFNKWLMIPLPAGIFGF